MCTLSIGVCRVCRVCRVYTNSILYTYINRVKYNKQLRPTLFSGGGETCCPKPYTPYTPYICLVIPGGWKVYGSSKPVTHPYINRVSR